LPGGVPVDARELDAATPDLKEQGQHGKPRDENNVTRFQDDASYAIARLRKDRIAGKKKRPFKAGQGGLKER
jgi:hypothetical protein